MKKFLKAMAVMIVLCAFAGFIQAGDYTVSLSTYSATGGSDFALAGYPNIAGGMRIDKIIISNSGATVQTIDWYDSATSTSTAVLAGTAVIASTGTLIIDFPSSNPPQYRNLAIKKSATGSTATATILYH